ncbi:DUF1343 domain-containing protein [Fulvivirga sp. RKSG066]|uniref:exo-beta-N-acetylmuramidase NamZ family protein n=1 Tax=Fulvivirga aurantia TaxID=2529383 RepID=UPI0012BD6490|nr:DUF1343 domain-containing protein [Fulvivirga aurantia]MTI22368.1 DUF1343 domain-containing protein [Fulvivirga aurantia]
MNRLILFLSFSFIIFSCKAQPGDPQAPIKVGAERFDQYIPLLESQSAGLVVNQTSIVGNTHLVDTLKALGVDIKKVFAPEHGFRGQADAGEVVKDGIDTRTQLPIISLYGKNKKPSADQLADIDVVIFDIQDVGARFYTYISTMHYVMEAAAENKKKVLILDRPNPNGMYVGGPVLEEEFSSFVGMHPIPIVHGLTVGELAQMINEEGWLENGAKADIEIVKCENYNHKMSYSLPVKPSPNLPNDLSIKIYPSLCLFEGTVISVGRGTYAPFQQIGHPDFEGMPHQFTPKSIEGMSKYPKHEGETCYGHLFEEQNATRAFDIQYLIDYYNLYNGKEPFFNAFFNKLAGNATLQQQIVEGKIKSEIEASWQAELNRYKLMRNNYLLYPDF